MEWTAEEIRDLGNEVTFAVIVQRGVSRAAAALFSFATRRWRNG